MSWTSSESSSSTSTLPNTASNTPPLNANSAYQDGYNKHGYEEEDFRVAVGQGMFDGNGLMSDLDQMLDEELQVRRGRFLPSTVGAWAGPERLGGPSSRPPCPHLTASTISGGGEEERRTAVECGHAGC